MSASLRDIRVEENRGGPRGGSRRFLSPFLLATLFVGLVFHLFFFLLFQVSGPEPAPGRTSESPFVSFVSADRLADEAELEERAMLYDSSPLFIPTKWNPSPSPEPGWREGAEGDFPEFEPEINLEDALRPSDFLSARPEVEEPRDLLDPRYLRLFPDFGVNGRAAAASGGTSGPMAGISILKGGGNGAPAPEVRPLSPELDYEPGSEEEVPRPAIIFFRITGDGVPLGGPVLGQSSGSDAFDGAALAWVRSPRVVARLPSGYLEIRVFP